MRHYVGGKHRIPMRHTFTRKHGKSTKIGMRQQRVEKQNMGTRC